MRNAAALFLAIAAWLAAAASAPACAQESRVALFYGGEDGRAAARDAWRRRVSRARSDYEAFAGRAVQVYLSFLNPAPERKAPRPTSILRDPTLRAGDIYAAPDGFMVFRGRIAGAHQPSDFAPMSDERARKLSLAIGTGR
ncbi:hypothetical protein ACNHKD_18835 [Methylocystis sp. JAN1]|uniref:hypothetical protein n=1 Tax=Methylocystis sp. JAN1 TaxID=3397211 RepID=UPI003FA2D4A9